VTSKNLLIVSILFVFFLSFVLMPGVIALAELTLSIRYARMEVEKTSKVYDSYNAYNFTSGDQEESWTAVEKAQFLFDATEAGSFWTAMRIKMGSPTVVGAVTPYTLITQFQDNSDTSMVNPQMGKVYIYGASGYRLLRATDGVYVASRTSMVELTSEAVSLTDKSAANINLNEKTAKYESSLYYYGIYRIEAFEAFFFVQFIFALVLFLGAAFNLENVLKVSNALGMVGVVVYFIAYVLAMDFNSLVHIQTWFSTYYGIGAWWNGASNNIFLSVILFAWMLVVTFGTANRGAAPSEVTKYQQ